MEDRHALPLHRSGITKPPSRLLPSSAVSEKDMVYGPRMLEIYYFFKAEHSKIALVFLRIVAIERD